MQNRRAADVLKRPPICWPRSSSSASSRPGAGIFADIKRPRGRAWTALSTRLLGTFNPFLEPMMKGVPANELGLHQIRDKTSTQPRT